MGLWEDSEAKALGCVEECPILASAAWVPADRLSETDQRTLAFLCIQLEPPAGLNAATSSAWRVVASQQSTPPSYRHSGGGTDVEGDALQDVDVPPRRHRKEAHRPGLFVVVWARARLR